MFLSSLSEEPVGVVIWDSADGSYNILSSRNDIMQPAKNSYWNISFSEIYEFMQLSDR